MNSWKKEQVIKWTNEWMKDERMKCMRSTGLMRGASFPLHPMNEWKTEWMNDKHTALLWQKEASDKSDISRKRAKRVCHLHWRQWNIRMSYLTYLFILGWVFLHEIWPGRRAHYVNYENINNSNLDGMSLASFCQSRAAYFLHLPTGLMIGASSPLHLMNECMNDWVNKWIIDWMNEWLNEWMHERMNK